MVFDFVCNKLLAVALPYDILSARQTRRDACEDCTDDECRNGDGEYCRQSRYTPRRDDGVCCNEYKDMH